MFNSKYLLMKTLPQSSLIQTMFSAETALLQVTNEWLWNIDIKHLNAVIFLDLKKTFNTINYAILLENLNSMESIVFLLNGFGPAHLTENSKLLLIELNQVSVM